MSNQKCYIHKNRIATTRCDRCGKPICLACTHKLTQRHRSPNSYYKTKHEYCSKCYPKMKTREDSKRSINLCCGLIMCGFVLIIFGIVTYVFTNFWESPF